MKADIRARYGGTNRELMMLRNAGKGGVQYMATALSQGDMQFLDGRITFTKEEIFPHAPGLSLRAVGQRLTEANSVSASARSSNTACGRIWCASRRKSHPTCCPTTAAGLVGEFADIHITDKQRTGRNRHLRADAHGRRGARQYYQTSPSGMTRQSAGLRRWQGLTPAGPDAEEKQHGHAADAAGRDKARGGEMRGRSMGRNGE